jgi:hypothetical protein
MPELFCSARAKCRQSFVSVNPAEIIGNFVDDRLAIVPSATVSPTVAEGPAGAEEVARRATGFGPKSYARFASKRAASLAW